MLENRWYQNEAEQATYDYLNNKKGNPVIALPTGTGKSLVIGNIAKNSIGYNPNLRCMMLTHVKELIHQNASKLTSIWPNAPLGIYSAGLKQRDTMLPITYGGVLSVANEIKRNGSRAFGKIDLLLIDECHLISPNDETVYMFVIAVLMEINPYMRVVGLSATPYRMRLGMITEGGIFEGIAYNLTTIEGYRRLIGDGFLSMPIPKATDTFLDITGVKMNSVGKFNEKQISQAVDTDRLNRSIVQETIHYGLSQNRQCWLTFANDIQHAEHLAALFTQYGIDSIAVHSKLSDAENAKRIRAYKAGYFRNLINADKLTTGFDHPPIDLICMARFTGSTPLWVQMVGRGTRPYDPRFPGDVDPYVYAIHKMNCLILDFAKNSERLGPINDPVIPTKPGAKSVGGMPIRICEKCGAYNAASARKCEYCAHVFTFVQKIFNTASSSEILKTESDSKIEVFDVKNIIYNIHVKKNREGVQISPPCIRVTYSCGLSKDKMFNEFVFFEHGGAAMNRAREWWKRRHNSTPPLTTHDAMEAIKQLRMRNEFPEPKQVRVLLTKDYPEILSMEF